MVGDVAFEQRQVVIEGISQIEALHQQQAGAQAGEASRFDLGGVVVVDVLVREEATACSCQRL